MSSDMAVVLRVDVLVVRPIARRVAQCTPERAREEYAREDSAAALDVARRLCGTETYVCRLDCLDLIGNPPHARERPWGHLAVGYVANTSAHKSCVVSTIFHPSQLDATSAVKAAAMFVPWHEICRTAGVAV
jgi:hypothetical protein